MSQPAYDPTAAWADMIQKWEQEINSWSGKFTQNEQFSAMMGQATKFSMAAQKTMADQMENVLRSLNLPSKAQMEALGERLDGIEEQLERIRLAMERTPSAASEAAPAVKRTRKPPQDKA